MGFGFVCLKERPALSCATTPFQWHQTVSLRLHHLGERHVLTPSQRMQNAFHDVVRGTCTVLKHTQATALLQQWASKMLADQDTKVCTRGNDCAMCL